jgi:RND family efflux transporter MFP subunit
MQACYRLLMVGMLSGFSSMTWAATDGSCLIEPSMEVKVGFPVDGVLDQVLVDRGDLIDKGQLLARLQSGVEQASVDYHSAKAAFGGRKKDRTEALQRDSLISKQEHDEIATDQKLAEMELREKREQLKLRTVTSPIRGVVVDRYHHPGDLIHQEHVLRVAQLDPLYVEVVLPVTWFGKIAQGEFYDVTPQPLGGSYKAQVVAVDRVIDAASSTFRVRLSLANKKYELPSGLRCTVDFSKSK